jgi:integrase
MKKKKARRNRTVPMSGDVYQAVLDQRQRFIDKFGREPGPSNPLFFDPDADTPQQITEEKLDRLMNEALSAAGVDPALVYAYNMPQTPMNDIITVMGEAVTSGEKRQIRLLNMLLLFMSLK